ncbi:UDP-2,4-diacetamido-2,4,6-trideoxy-beta-L-altropyranose hydrolase [Devosia ginsengisoli]|uniref:UDP-2,4-diacetamido-2,4, 6-trideoxy-beta-L-altropyranose hydrolase n=1 Tax=Devosia ginsengisoli TaxID=400770 RepID=UPI0026EE892A|nr:UDP-2,4-diacetamido-2,4,6-trideoxy-beta-L-altropyranose hydrolase [Devosia ginsengisoli]MCR6672048.1 UDP-2,4-diacetamido-2,4,6-trideoxy-beta-L-altropyranose hydrolase [Devosia ginsengisoli]
MKIVFRADASLDMGTGHVMRSLALAQALADRGARIRFVCRDHAGNLAERIKAHGFAVTLLPLEALAPSAEAPAYSQWIGASWAVDAEQTLATISEWNADWVVVDHYGLDARWETLVRSSGTKLLAIDDLANRTHQSDAVLDQNYFQDPDARYADLVPPQCALWLGPRYALLQRVFASKHRHKLAGEAGVHRVLVFVGGSDRTNLTGFLVSILARPEFSHLHLDVVLGVNHEHREAVEALVARRPGTELHSNLPSLVDLMVAANLAIGAGGGATWERFCVGLPSVVISLAPNQEAICNELAAAGLITYAGRLDDLDATAFGSQLRELLDSPARLQTQSLKGQAMVDGLGTARIAEFMMPTVIGKLSCRPARADDMLDYFSWANDTANRANAINSAAIPLDDHLRWFAGKLGAAGSWLYVLEASDVGVGQVRFDRQDDGLWIDYALDRLVRGRGWGGELIRLGARNLPLPPDTVLRARVKRSNPASAAVFRRLGFSEHESDAELLQFQCELGAVIHQT